MARRQIPLREKRLMSGVFGVLAALALVFAVVFFSTGNSLSWPAALLCVVWAAVAVYYARAPTKAE